MKTDHGDYTSEYFRASDFDGSPNPEDDAKPNGNGADTTGSGERRKTRDQRFKLVPFDEIKLGTQRRYLVKGLIPRVGLTVIWGPPKCGKSFSTFDISMYIALGWEYRGRRTHQGAVVYCALEGQEGFKARKEAFCQRHLPDGHGPVPFYLLPATLDLVADHEDIITAIKLQLVSAKPVLVVLDTLNRSLRGSESSDEDMGAYIRAADAIRVEFDCAIVIVHHCGTDGTRPRGHTSLGGAVEAQISVKRDAANNVVATIEWLKDGREGDTVISRLETIEVGVDEDGELITSCVVVPVEDAPGKAAAIRWPRALVFYHRALLAALDNFGEGSLPFADGPTVRAVNREHVRDEFRRIYPADGDTAAKKGDATKQAFKRAERDAIARNLIICRESSALHAARARPP